MDSEYYTFRAVIRKFRRDGRKPVIPLELKNIPGFPPNEKHRYFICVYAITRSNEQEMVSVASAIDIQTLIAASKRNGIGLTLVEPQQRIVGPLAPMHGTWRIERLPAYAKGVCNPHPRFWRKHYNPKVYYSSTGNLATIREVLLRVQQREMLRHGRFRRTFRIVLNDDQQVRGKERKYSLFSFYNSVGIKFNNEDE